MIQIVFLFIKLILMKFELYFSPSVFKYDKQLGMGNHIFLYIKKYKKKVDKKHWKKNCIFAWLTFVSCSLHRKKKFFTIYMSIIEILYGNWDFIRFFVLPHIIKMKIVQSKAKQSELLLFLCYSSLVSFLIIF